MVLSLGWPPLMGMGVTIVLSLLIVYEFN